MTRLLRMCQWLFYAGIVYLGSAQEVLAQAGEEQEKGKNYTVVYIVIIACVGGCLSLMLRSGKRTTDFPRYGQLNRCTCW